MCGRRRWPASPDTGPLVHTVYSVRTTSHIQKNDAKLYLLFQIFELKCNTYLYSLTQSDRNGSSPVEAKEFRGFQKQIIVVINTYEIISNDT